MNKEPLKFIDVVTPEDFQVISPTSIQTCELLFTILLNSPVNKFLIEFDLEDRSVICDTVAIKQLLIVIIGAGKWPSFIRQLTEYLKKTGDDNSEGILSLVAQDRPHEYLVTINSKQNFGGSILLEKIP